ncbi:hypothetical protein RN001_011118 [Aquatica leii]|uniref:Cytochrome P450 n=1 Tax=Aquatica leii TaxID=1421715 RepID=A0AAN7SEV3_9COLE|nr:hypothetical protein RN001_011118 [Aquatica leii]
MGEKTTKKCRICLMEIETEQFYFLHNENKLMLQFKLLDFLPQLNLNITPNPIICNGSIIAYCKWVYTYWERLGVPYLEPSIPFGTNKDVFLVKCSQAELAAKQYKTAKARGYKHVGIFGFIRPEYMPIDLELLKHILVKDFNHFTDRGFYCNEEIDPLAGNLFVLNGNRWKKIRAKLTPTFTSGKMKLMFNLVVECYEKLKKSIDTERKKGPVNIKNFLEQFSIDVIGSCAFGLDCNSFGETESNFWKYSKQIFAPTVGNIIKSVCSVYFRSINKFFKWKIIPSDVSDFFLSVVRNSAEYRKTNNVVRNDFLQILIELMKGESGLTIEEITAEALVFFLAGFETSSATLTYALLELAAHQDIQQKLREEVKTVMERHNQVMTYESLKEMVYMQQVFEEVLRKYPPLSFLNRVCTEEYLIPNTDITLKKGTNVLISIMGIHHDPEYFPEPEKFDPERFSLENKQKLNHFSYMPFGEGPRLCIGSRFAYLQMRIALSSLIQNYKFTLNEQTKLPMKIDPKSLVIYPMDPIWLDVEKL